MPWRESKNKLHNELWDVAHNYLEECEICGAYHPKEWWGDCRDDKNRFQGPESLVEIWLNAPSGDKDHAQYLRVLSAIEDYEPTVLMADGEKDYAKAYHDLKEMASSILA